MSKLILSSFCAISALALSACGPRAEENVAVENVEDLNAVDTNMDMDLNMDMNATDLNAADAMNSTDAANATTGNSSGY